MTKTLLLSFCLSLCITSCLLKSNNNTNDPINVESVSEFRLMNDSLGWSETAQGGYTEYDDSASLYSIIDGGATKYTDRGMVEGFEQKLSGEGEKTLRVMAMDFGTTENAATIFDFITSDLPPSLLVTFGSYDVTRVTGTSFAGGVQAYSHFNRFYFEISLSGFDSTSLAVESAAQLMAYYENKL